MFMSKSKMYRSILLLMIICTVITIWIYKIINEKVPYVDQLTRGFVDFVAPTKIYDFADRKSTRLNSSHVAISYAVFCLQKKRNYQTYQMLHQHLVAMPKQLDDT